MGCSRLASETDEIIQFEHVRPGFDVLARAGKFSHVFREELHRLGVAVRPTAIHVIAPMLDLPRRAFVFCGRQNPLQDFTVAFALLQFGEQLLRINADKLEEVLIHRAVKVVLAVCAGERGATLIERPCQDGVAANARARATRRSLREIRCSELDNAWAHPLARLPRFLSRRGFVTCLHAFSGRFHVWFQITL